MRDRWHEKSIAPISDVWPPLTSFNSAPLSASDSSDTTMVRSRDAEMTVLSRAQYFNFVTWDPNHPV